MQTGKLLTALVLGVGLTLACLGLLVAASPPVTRADLSSIAAAPTGASIALSKTIHSPLPPIVAGSDVIFLIHVENTGDVGLVQVNVTDPAAPVCNRNIGGLGAGETFVYYCIVEAVESGMFVNVAEACGKSVLDPGLMVCSSDSVSETVVPPSGAAIAIDKAPGGQTVAWGGDAVFTITVENTGVVTLAQVTVADALAPGCDAAIGSLNVGQVHSHTCSLLSVTAALTNTAVVSAASAVLPSEVVTDADAAPVTVLWSVYLPLVFRE